MSASSSSSVFLLGRFVFRVRRVRRPRPRPLPPAFVVVAGFGCDLAWLLAGGQQLAYRQRERDPFSQDLRNTFGQWLRCWYLRRVRGIDNNLNLRTRVRYNGTFIIMPDTLLPSSAVYRREVHSDPWPLCRLCQDC